MILFRMFFLTPMNLESVKKKQFTCRICTCVGHIQCSRVHGIGIPTLHWNCIECLQISYIAMYSAHTVCFIHNSIKYCRTWWRTVVVAFVMHFAASKQFRRWCFEIFLEITKIFKLELEFELEHGLFILGTRILKIFVGGWSWNGNWNFVRDFGNHRVLDTDTK